MNHRLIIVSLLSGSLFSFVPLFAQDDFIPVTDSMLQDPDPADWLMWRRTLNSWGYSPLDEVNHENVSSLELVWSRPLGTQPGFQEGTPLVYNGIMYMPSPGDEIHAIDAATGELIWEHQREIPEGLIGLFRAATTNRNLAIYGNFLINTSADDYIFALDATTGELAWETEILDYLEFPSQQTSGPIIANGLAVSGRGCDPGKSPLACVVTAHNAVTGEEVWRTSTIQSPDDEDDTWGGVPYEVRGHVGTWMIPSFDPELNLIYVGTSVTSPAPKYLFAGNDKQYLYHNSTLALDADTGEIKWYYQHVVDHWDLDHPFARLLVDTAVAPDPESVSWINPDITPGEIRKVLTGIPGKTGIIYTLDRETGEFLWATPTVDQNVVSDIDGETGSVTVNPESLFHAKGDVRWICPGSAGGLDWQAGAYSPQTNAMYYPLQNLCMTATAQQDYSEERVSIYGLSMPLGMPEGEENLGTIYAVSAESGEQLWKYEQRGATMSLLTTGGGLVFAGDGVGKFFALGQEDGAKLWEHDLGSFVTGYPASFSVDGKQYIAISTGVSLSTSQYVSFTPELTPGSESTLFVFALPSD
jgi:PQQ-dependent dehydrogenase (methanol/ethanol family)